MMRHILEYVSILLQRKKSSSLLDVSSLVIFGELLRLYQAEHAGAGIAPTHAVDAPAGGISWAVCWDGAIADLLFIKPSGPAAQTSASGTR